MKRKSNQFKPVRKSRSGADFPLSRHPRGYWCKRYKRPDGKWAMAYFGKLVTNAFLNAKQMAMEAGEIGARTMAEYIAPAERLARVFGSIARHVQLGCVHRVVSFASEVSKRLHVPQNCWSVRFRIPSMCR